MCFCLTSWWLCDHGNDDCHRMRATAGLSKSTKTTELSERTDTSSRSIVQTPRFRGGLGKRSVCKNIGDSRGDLTKRPSPDLSERSSSWPSRQRVDGSEQADGRTDGHPASFEEYLADFQAMWGMGYIHKANKLYRSRCLSFSFMFHCCSNISHSSEETQGIPQISSAMPSHSFLLVNLLRIYIL